MVRRFVLIAIVVTIASSHAVRLHAQSTLIPLTTRRDFVFDHSGTFLFITTSDGFVRRYNLNSGVLEDGYSLRGSLYGIDITADDSFLLAAQRNSVDRLAGSTR